MLLHNFLEQTALKLPDKTALVQGGRRMTYAELDRQANQLAHALQSLGVRRGDRVVIHLGNEIETIVSLFAVLKAAGVFVMVNPTTKATKLAYLLDNSGAAAVIVQARRLDALGPTLAQREHLRSVVTVGRGVATEPAGRQTWSMEMLLTRHAADVTPPTTPTIDLDLAALLYTSGSSGEPKGVMVTHRNMISAAESITTYLENTEDDVLFNLLPLSFSYGLYQPLMAAKFGGTVVLEQSLAYPHAVLAKLVQERATGLPLVPTMAALLLQLDLEKYDLSSLRYITSAGAALPIEHLEGLRYVAPGAKIFVMYGQTECARAAYLPPDQLDQRPTSVGRGMPNQEVAVVDEHGERVEPGETGELVIRGSHVMKGYWEMPEATAATLRPGPFDDDRPVLWTGDLFRIDEEGYLYFVARKDDVIKCRGEKVSPREVEDVLYRHPSVAEAAVIGVRDDVWGEAVKAFVVLRPDDETSQETDEETDKQALLRHCAEHLEDYMVPREIEFREELPKSDNGKILKRELREVPVSNGT
ncbi:MAG TPA: AMP-binding protein [Thermoguttaceae bacterium]|nr:AMP-binding protein [Thermoguttaceae bacterium]